jgi:hypothetical protein
MLPGPVRDPVHPPAAERADVDADHTSTEPAAKQALLRHPPGSLIDGVAADAEVRVDTSPVDHGEER